MNDKRVHGGVSLGSVQDPHSSKPGEPKQVLLDRDIEMAMMKGTAAAPRSCSVLKQYEVASADFSAEEGDHFPRPVAVPEGRVHGGSLMAMLTGNSSGGSSSRKGLASTNPSEPIKGHFMPQSWI